MPPTGPNEETRARYRQARNIVIGYFGYQGHARLYADKIKDGISFKVVCDLDKEQHQYLYRILARMADKVVGPLRNRMYSYYRFYFLNGGGQNEN